MTDLVDYQNFYLLTDLLLLTAVFKNFRNVCLQHSGLDPFHDYTSPGLSWQAALKITDVELDFLTDIDQHLFIMKRSGERWQWSATDTLKQSRAPGMENYDVIKCNSYIMYLDANNLYEWALSQPLPTSNFKWLTDEEMKDLDMMMMPDDVRKDIF